MESISEQKRNSTNQTYYRALFHVPFFEAKEEKFCGRRGGGGGGGEIVVEEIFRAERGGVRSAKVMGESWRKSEVWAKAQTAGKDTKGKGRPMYIRMYVHMLLVHTFFFFF